MTEKIRIAAHIEVAWLHDEPVAATCPNCDFTGEVQRYLEIDYRPPGAAHRFVLQICPRCTARFSDNPETMDYGTDELIEIGWHVYQIQLGAGVWPITAPLTRIEKPAGAKILEIGGAYGFGLDFAISARGWRGEGFDPSPLAAFGATELGLTIHQDYFEAKDLGRGPYDVAMATEVIEHLPHPPAFLALLRRALWDDGILILTTPDAAWITPDLPAAQLMPLLSPGAHLVLQTAESLRLALAAAGFAQVSVVQDGMSLIAYASAAPFVLNQDTAAGRGQYRHYLLERGRLAPPNSDLRLGFAGRGLFEAANDGDFAAADAAWAILCEICRARFGLDLTTITALPDGAQTADLATLGRLMPLGLGMILFGRAMQLLGAQAARADLLPLLTLAAEAADALQQALAQRSLTDGLSASILQAIAGEIALCHADAGDPAAVDALIGWAGQNKSAPLPWQGLVGLINAGAFGPAQTLRTALHLDWPGMDLPADLQRDALLSLANLALAPGRDPMPAFDLALALRKMGAAEADGIMLGAFTRLVNAGDFARAEQAAAAHGIEALSSGAPNTAAADAQLGFVMLDFGQSRTEAALARLHSLPPTPLINHALVDCLHVEGFVRLVNEGRFAAARRLAGDHAIAGILPACKPALRQDALAAFLLLEAQPGGDPQRLPEWLQALAEAQLDEDRLNELIFVAFGALVNRGEIDIARRLLPKFLPVLGKLHPPYQPAGRNALFAHGMLAVRDKAESPRGLLSLARLRDDLLKHAVEDPDGLFWPALRGEMLILNQLNRPEDAAALLADFAPRYPGVPDDLAALLPRAETAG